MGGGEAKEEMSTTKDNGKFSLLFSSILDSSIWDQDAATRVVWITILAMKNGEGYVRSTFKGLVRNANVTPDECEKALKIFTSPDPDSNSKLEEGRRLREVEGGWYVINHAKYQYSSEERREYWRRMKAEQRKRDEIAAARQMATQGEPDFVPRKPKVSQDKSIKNWDKYVGWRGKGAKVSEGAPPVQPMPDEPTTEF